MQHKTLITLQLAICYLMTACSGNPFAAPTETPIPPTMTPTHELPPGTPITNGQGTPIMVQKIAFVSARDGNAEVYVMNSDGTGQVNLTNNPAEDWFPAWSPNGKQIAFSSGRDGDPAIYIMNADGSNLIRLTEPGNSFPAWSPDGTRIAFACYLPNSQLREICTMNLDGSGKKTIDEG